MDEEKLNNIRKLLNINGSNKSHEEAIIDIVNAIKHLIPNFKKFDTDQLKVISEEIEKNIITIYDKYLTNDDVLKIIDFYNSETGKIYLSKMSKISLEVMNLGNKYGEIVYNKLIILNNNDEKLNN